MRVTIAIFAVLIVGSNAGVLGNLLDPVAHVLDAATASAQAKVLLNSLQSQITQKATNATLHVNGALQEVNVAIQGLEADFLALSQKSSEQDLPDLTALLNELPIEELLGVFANATDLASKIPGVIIGLNS